MSRLEEIKNEYAKEMAYDNWRDLCIKISNREGSKERMLTDIIMHNDEASKIYAEECVKASLEKVDKSFKNTATKSINTALKYFEESNRETVYKRDVISFLHAFHQFESQGLSIVGMGYKRYDAKEITDLVGAYEGGYFTEKKECQVTNHENIVLL